MSLKPFVNVNEELESMESSEDTSWQKILSGMETIWEESIPSEAPLLSNIKKADFEKNDQIKQWFAMVNTAMLPFHHLIPLEKIASTYKIAPSKNDQSLSEKSRANRRQYFWQMLATSGVSAREAALLDDSLQCHFIEYVESQPVEIDWQVLFYDELGGCAEIYRAEMLIVKRRVYEAGEELRSVIELASQDLLSYLTQETFATLGIENVSRLFMDNLFTPFTLTVSGTIKHDNDAVELKNNKINQSKKGKVPASTTNSYRTYRANRLETWMSREGNDSYENEELTNAAENVSRELKIEDKSKSDEAETSIIRATLATYWLDWQRLALIAGFDFNYLEALDDIRAIRFYELTKLWRTSLVKHAGDKLPAQLKVEYDKFASLMPLPRQRSVPQINSQMRQLIKPFKDSGYIKSFAVKTDWRDIESRNVQLSLRFEE